MSPILLAGLRTTLGLLAASVPAGLAIALVVALASSARAPALRLPARAFVAAFRGTPLLVQIFLIYYGLAQFAWLRHSPLWPVLRHAWPCVLIALSLSMGAYAAEVVRAALGAVPRGEREAAASLGLSRAAAFRAVVLPRALRLGLPALVNEVLVQLKATALASTVTVLDLTGAARRLAAASFTVGPLLEAAAIYAALAAAIGLAATGLERALRLPGRGPAR